MIQKRLLSTRLAKKIIGIMNPSQFFTSHVTPFKTRITSNERFSFLNISLASIPGV